MQKNNILIQVCHKHKKIWKYKISPFFFFFNTIQKSGINVFYFCIIYQKLNMKNLNNLQKTAQLLKKFKKKNSHSEYLYSSYKTWIMDRPWYLLKTLVSDNTFTSPALYYDCTARSSKGARE